MGNVTNPATSIDAARHHLEQWVLPRRIRDLYAEMLYFHKNGENRKIYRKVLLDEEDRGIQYPIWTTGVRLLAHFGIGVGIYFAQLIILCIILFLGGLVLSPSIQAWRDADYLGENSTPYLSSTAAMNAAHIVEASDGCDGGGTCDALYRENSLNRTAIICDLIMIIFIFIGIYGSQFIESNLKEEFDEAVQSAQDYAVYVADPTPSAIDPDEWYRFFSRFGKVMYITVTKKNLKLKDLLEKKHLLVRDVCAIVGDTDNFYHKYYGGYTNIGDNDEIDYEEEQRRKDILNMFDDEKQEDNKRHVHMKELFKHVEKYVNAPTYSDDDGDGDESSSEDKNLQNDKVSSNSRNNAITAVAFVDGKSGNTNTTTSGAGKATTEDHNKSLENATKITMTEEKAKRMEFLNLEKIKKRMNKEKLLKLENELAQLNKDISLAFNEEYPANQVYAIFEYEEHQRLTISELEVADIETKDLANANSKILFRGENVLKVAEPPEPDNILWSNNEVTTNQRRVRNFISRSITVGIFIGCYLLVRYYQVTNDDPIALAAIIGGIDAILPTIFLKLSNWEAQRNEGLRQESLQVKLFGTRLLLSTIFPYINIPWNRFLDPSNIEQNFSVQLAACFTAPIVQLVDIPTLVQRWILGPLQSVTQKELNLAWSGVQWTLAERYTNISKILFISLFYALLQPSSLFIASLAFGLLFLIDRYLLLRHWEQPLLMDESVAKRLRQQALVAVTVHAFVSMRFIYSWPMDNAYFDNDKQIYVKVDKEPTWNVFLYEEQDWQSRDQKELIPYYKIITCLLIVFTLYVLFGENVKNAIHKYFFKVVEFVGDAQYIPFSSLSRVPVYVPEVSLGNDRFMFADISKLKKKHYPVIKKLNGSELPDLSVYVPHSCMGCLSVVKYYGDDEDNRISRNTTSNASTDEADITKSKRSKQREKLILRPDFDIESGKNASSKDDKIKPDSTSAEVKGNTRHKSIKQLSSNPDVVKLDKYLEEYRLHNSRRKPTKRVAKDKEKGSKDSSTSSSNVLETADIISSFRGMIRRTGGKSNKEEDDEIKGRLRASISGFFKKMVTNSSLISSNKSTKIAPMVSSDREHYSEFKKSTSLHGLWDVGPSHSEDLVKTSSSNDAIGNNDTSFAPFSANTNFDLDFDFDLDLDFEDNISGSGGGGGGHLDDCKSYKNIKRVTFYNPVICEIIPNFLDRGEIDLLRRINGEFLEHDDYDPTTIFDNKPDFVSFVHFYDRLVILSPDAIYVPKYQPNIRGKIKESSEEILQKQQIKLKLRHLFSQIVFIQKELLLNKSSTRGIMLESELKVVERSLDGAISWRIFLCILFNTAVV